MVSFWEEYVYFCPDCGKKSLYQHTHYDTGNNSAIPFCYCVICNAEFFMIDVDPKESYYGPENNEDFIHPVDKS
jgi:hypothetical protein